MDIWGACVSVHPPRETKTRRGADRRALGGRRASPCGGGACPLMGEIISLLGFWGFSGGVRRRPQTTQTAFGGNRRKTGFRRGTDERKNQNGQVHHHPGHARAERDAILQRSRCGKSGTVVLCLRTLLAHIADFVCGNGQISIPCRPQFKPIRFYCVIIYDVST